ncbi:YrvL family regulatory protein [Paenibacillus polygoni]|uniref:YrvL family regulatory protein n=1 Tax=Paenibacillus polygoni TaxID=3050112 RepID=A0ABY8XCR1_9BACL|nr:YrvL family regulatory protein [Paenibacillus polygoni]WIV21205.1 YrvL family regulatory protein [Paenibacillus polygoni]
MNKMKRIMIPFVIVLIILVGLTIFEFFVLHLLGLQYKSAGGLILFFVLYLLLEIPLSLITDAMPKALKSVGIIKSSKGWLPLTLDTGLPFILILLLDAFISDITITWQGAMIFSLVTGIISRKVKESEKEPPVWIVLKSKK